MFRKTDRTIHGVPVYESDHWPGRLIFLNSAHLEKATGAELRDAGIEKATDGGSVALQVLWRDKALYCIAKMALADATFDAEDLRRAIGPPPTPNAIGAAFRTAYKKGWIRPVTVRTADRPSRHASLIRTWTRA